MDNLAQQTSLRHAANDAMLVAGNNQGDDMTKRNLRVGLLLDAYDVSAWSLKMIENIMNSHFAEISLVVLNEGGKTEAGNRTLISKVVANRGRIITILIRKALESAYKALVERNTSLPDASENMNCEQLLSDIPTMKVKTIRKQWSDYFHNEDIKEMGDHNIDIFIRCGFGILRGDILSAAKYGVWSFHHGDNLVNRGGPAGFWESMESWPETGSMLQILTEDLDGGQVLYRSFSCTDTMSVQDNKSGYFWKSLSFMTRKMQELHDLGEKTFFEKVEHDNRHPVFYSERLYARPTNRELAGLTFRKARKKAILLYENRFFLRQWILMFHLKNSFSSSLWRYKKIRLLRRICG
jgi:hypothetical protein